MLKRNLIIVKEPQTFNGIGNRIVQFLMISIQGNVRLNVCVITFAHIKPLMKCHICVYTQKELTHTTAVAHLQPFARTCVRV